MTPQSQATRDALVLGVLNAHGGFPISTTEVANSVHPSGQGHIWAMATLKRLEKRGEIERLHPDGSRSYYWRR